MLEGVRPGACSPNLLSGGTHATAMLFGPLTVGKKAAAWGYRKYGLPGALAAGVVGVAGYLAVRSTIRDALRGENGAEGADGGNS